MIPDWSTAWTSKRKVIICPQGVESLRVFPAPRVLHALQPAWSPLKPFSCRLHPRQPNELAKRSSPIYLSISQKFFPVFSSSNVLENDIWNTGLRNQENLRPSINSSTFQIFVQLEAPQSGFVSWANRAISAKSRSAVYFLQQETFLLEEVVIRPTNNLNL